MTGLQKVSASALAAAATIVVAACGSSSSGGTAAAPATAAAGATGSNVGALHSASTPLGNVLVDARGRTVYELAGNTATQQKCTSVCQGIWPPVMAGGHIKVVNGHPAFTFSGDSGPGQTHGQGVTDTWGHWSALGANGNPVTSTPASAPAATTGGGGGQYGY